jgi:hypothetical protein
MGHRIRLFAGPLPALRPFLAAAATARIFALGSADIVVFPLTDDVHDDLHAAYGTGNWLVDGPLLTTTDLAFAADASRGSGLAFLSTDFFGASGEQCAILWRDGGLALKPMRLSSELMQARSPSFWPINIALKGLGLLARPGEDEFTTFGLGRWRQTEDIVALAPEVSAGR